VTVDPARRLHHRRQNGQSPEDERKTDIQSAFQYGGAHDQKRFVLLQATAKLYQAVGLVDWLHQTMQK